MKNFPFNHNNQELWYSRSLAVSCLVYTRDIYGNIYVLANKRGQGCEFNKGLWNVPGGFIDFDETAQEAASRELYEETGVSIDPNDWKFVELDTNPNNGMRQTMVARYSIWVDMDIDKQFTSKFAEPDEVETIEWIPIDKLDDYEWTRSQKRAIIKYID